MQGHEQLLGHGIFAKQKISVNMFDMYNLKN